MAVTVRSATPIDAPAIARMSVALVEQHHRYDAQRFARVATIEGMERFYGGQTQNENARVLVAEIDEKLVGFVYMVYEPINYADLSVLAAKVHDIYVDAGERGSGIGRALVVAAAEEAKSLGANKILLSVAAKNERGIAFFASQGFETTMQEMMVVLDSE